MANRHEASRSVPLKRGERMRKQFSKFVALGTMLGILLLMGGQAVIANAEVAADTTPPADVEGLAAIPGDGQITLTWDPATDDTGTTGYYVYSGLSSVVENGGSYTFGSTDAGDTTTYVMDSLSNGVTYYFAVTAYDAAGNESEYYSVEAEATPEESDTGDFTEPTVVSAEALTSTLVTVEFSEDVNLPTNAETAFSIEATDGTALEVVDAYLSDNEAVVFVVTSQQTAGAQYILTAGIDIEDTAGNPIVSGTSDTARFTGSGLVDTGDDEETDADADETDTDETDDADTGSTEFTLDEIETTELNELVLTFSQEVSVADPDSFIIEMVENPLIEVDVLAVSIDDEDAKVVTLITDDMNEGYEYVLLLDEGVLNVDGDAMTEEAREVEFLAKTKDLADLIAPEDITNLLGSIVDETTVLLSWTASVDSAGDLAQYLVYKSADEGTTYGYATYVSKDVTEQEMSGLTPGATYTFKVTAVDENGNESEGVLTTVTLPETGPGMIAIFGLSLLGAGALSRRRKDEM